MTIPSSVTSIGNSAFYACSSLTSVTIPNSVTSIGSSAFVYCSGLTSITIPNSVTSIGDGAFSVCGGLISVTVEAKTPIDVSENVFSNRTNATLYVPVGCKAAYEAADYWKEFKEIIDSESAPSTGTEVIDGIYYNLNADKTAEVTKTPDDSPKYSGTIVIPASVTYNTTTYSVTSIGDGAFSYCSGLTSVTIPNSVTSIGDRAFFYCSGLTSVTIPNSVTSIGEGAFNNCSGLTSVTIPNSVTSIGDYAFSGCNGLTSLSVEAGNTKYDSRENCNAIIETETNKLVCGTNNTIIPNSVTSIGDYAFIGCSALTSITIPNSVTSIGSSAFYECSGLTSLSVEAGNTKYDSRDNCNAIIETETNKLVCGTKNTIIPNSVTSIGDGAFEGCNRLTSVTIPNSVTSIGARAFPFCSGLTSITIPNSVTSIGSSAFYYCSGLTSISIPNSVTSIGDYAFYYCSGLTSVTVETETPITISDNVFSNRANATLYVPAGSKAAYEAADYWREFMAIEEIGTDLPADELFYGSNLWAGYVAQEDLIPGMGLQAYVITNLGMTTATASPIDYMPQGVPVLLKRDDTTINSFEFSPGTGTAPTTNLLRAYDTDKSVSNREGFILYNDEFVLVSEGTLPARRIFLPANNVLLSRGLTRSIVIDGDGTTGIEDLEERPAVEEGPYDVYDLSGRKVANQVTSLDGLPHGIYIVNGKKILKR